MRTVVNHRAVKPRSLIRVGVAAMMALVGSGIAAHAQDWPTKNVTIVVPYAAGGIADLLARLSGQILSKQFGKPFVVDNRATGGGVVAANYVSAAAADGYTLFLSPPGPIVVIPSMQKVTYNPDRFVPITIVAHFPLLFAIKSSIPANTFPEFIAYAKANPGKLNYASGGVGSVTHLLTALLTKRAGLDIVHVPYKGSQPATTALIGGEIDMFFGTPSELLPQVSTGKIKIIATSGSERLPTHPDVPAISETLPGFRLSAWNGLFAAPGTPQTIIQKIADTVIGALKTPEVADRLTTLGVFPGGATPDQFGKIIQEDKEFYKEALKAAGQGPQ